MRLSRLALLRYGAFTDRTLEFPVAPCDFHVIHGPNEAGKSTLRHALDDLLFGFDHITRHDFRHKSSELRLGATLTQGDDALAFVRRKGAKQTLRDGAGQPLPDDALHPLLGGVDKSFFHRMFSLDPTRLRQGGRELLAAGDDAGPMLLAADTGLHGLKGLHQGLEEEARAIFAPRAASHRSFYQALDRGKEAEKRMREASVRVETWKEAVRALEEIDTRRRELTRQLEVLTQSRELCQRQRRVLPLLAELERLEQRIAELAPLPEPPPESGAVAEVEQEWRLLVHHEESAREREEELPLLRRRVAAFLEELGLDGEGLDAMARVMPRRAGIAPLRRLLVERGEVLARRREAEQQVARRREAVAQREEALILAGPVPDRESLVAALRLARQGQGGLREERKLREDCLRIEARLAEELAGLAPWRGTPEGLTALATPGVETVQGFLDEERRLREARDRLAERMREVRVRIAERRGERRQLLHEGRAVKESALLAARARRDQGWSLVARILDGDIPDNEEIDSYAGDAPLAEVIGAAMLQADDLADQRYREAGASARLTQVEGEMLRLQAQMDPLREDAATSQREREAWAVAWRGVAPFDAAPVTVLAWLARRERVLARWREGNELARRVAALAQEAGESRRYLADALVLLGAAPGEAAPLDLLVEEGAERERTLLARDEEQRVARQQLAAERASLLREGEALERALVAEAAWWEAWRGALAAMAWPGAGEPEGMGDLLTRLEGAWEALARARELEEGLARRLERRRAVAGLVEELARRLAPQWCGHPTGEVLAGLVHTYDAQRRARDERVALDQRREELLTRLAGEGDGRGLLELRRECVGVDGDLLPGRIGQVQREMDERHAALEQLSAERVKARARQEVMAGGDGAARAACDREQALAELQGEAVRHARLWSAARVLGWVLERYRRAGQGPLLQRAGVLFGILTRGSFEALELEFDDQARPRLIGVRSGGEGVAPEGMSDGTVDQLYLALRVAAVELHLFRGGALPFVVDDLFIHFDDGRAEAGLLVLAELARHTQVLFLTHHVHLVELARRVLPGQHEVHAL